MVDFLDAELSWRRRELTNMRFLALGGRRHEQEVLLRAGVCLMYAHWEGFVKDAATCYVNYVALKGLKYRDLSPSMVALGLRGKLRAAEETNRVTVHTEVTNFLLSDMHENAKLPWADAVTTRDNLNSEVLREILHLLDLDHQPYETKRVLLDQRLLRKRNEIAHGEHSPVSRTDYDELHAEVLDLLDRFRDDVENAAQLKRFQRSSPV
ncbi:MAG: hypothetical protein CYG60_19545 [Actinobacteria bacterium]|nr:MAG: hypothetical protein CYG60_19545 [Actinomycetota bacterium]